MNLFFFIVYLLIFMGIIYYWRFFKFKEIKRTYLIFLFLLKVGIGFILVQIYTDHYDNRKTGDTFRFYDDAVILHESLKESPAAYFKLLTGIGIENDETAQKYYLRMTHLEREYQSGFINDNGTVIRLNALLMPFTRGYYYTHILFWCFFSLIGLTAIFRLCIHHFPHKKWAMFLAVFLLPTVLFWTSGVLKEPIFILALGIFLLGFMRFIYGEQKTGDYFKIIFGFLLLLVVKGYVIQCMAPALVGLLLAKVFHGRKFWLWFSIPHILVVLLLFVGPHISDSLKVSEIMNLKQTAFYNVAKESNAGSVLEINPIESPVQILTNSPRALVNTYLRPWPWEWNKPLYIPAALENLMLVIALGLMFWNFRRPYGLNIPMLAFCGSFVLVLGVLTGMVVPVLGALVRYKLPALIFLFVMIFALTDHIKLQRRLPIIRKWIRRL